MPRLRRHGNIAKMPENAVASGCQMPHRAYVDSNSYRLLLLDTGTPRRFEPRRPQKELRHSIPNPIEIARGADRYFSSGLVSAGPLRVMARHDALLVTL